MTRFGKKLRALMRRRQLDRDLEDELRFHLEMKAEETGNQEEERRRVGNATTLEEVCRELWSFSMLETWWQDVRYAVRTLAKTPGFTVVAVTALALGIGADTAIFTIANGAFSWDMGLDHPDRIVIVNLVDTAHGEDFGGSYPDFRDLRSQSKTLAALGAYTMSSVNLSDTKTLPERYLCVRMSANGFDVSEQKPALGRGFSAEDERPGAPPVVELTYRVWEDRYGKDPSILGKTIHVNDVPVTVVGVMPPGRRFPEETDLWMPLVPNTQIEQRSNRNLLLFGRLAAGATSAGARAELDTLAARLAHEYPATNRGLTAGVMPIGQITGAYNMRPILVALWAAVGFVLLIACADVANMLLARGSGRMREISIRVAIGAGRARIVRQLLIESVLLSLAGGFLGWVVALGGLRWFDAGTGGMPKPVWLSLSLNTTAFAYLAAVSIVTGLLFGLAPALRLAKVDVHTAIKDGGQGVAGGRRALSISDLLVVFEMVLCVVLLAGAGLMIRSTVNLYDAPIGVDPSNVLTMQLNLPEAKYPLPADEMAFYVQLHERLTGQPGVETAALVSNLPLGGWMTFPLEMQGVVPGHTSGIVASAAYFDVMRLRPKRGRVFSDLDGITGPAVVLVNETFAAKYWPSQNALGKHLRVGKDLTVVGVVPDVLQSFQRPLDHEPLIYLPYGEQPVREMRLVARTQVPPATLAQSFRRTVQSLDENLPVYEVRSLEDHLAQRRLSVKLMGGMFIVFAGIALLLAAVGLYAVIAHAVSQRTQEIGVRIAMGGTRRDIVGLVYAHGMRPLAVGLLIGLPAAFGVTHVLRMMLVGVSPGDPLTFIMIVVVLVGAGVLGCAVPARRAVRVDPILALRYE